MVCFMIWSVHEVFAQDVAVSWNVHYPYFVVFYCELYYIAIFKLKNKLNYLSDSLKDKMVIIITSEYFLKFL